MKESFPKPSQESNPKATEAVPEKVYDKEAVDRSERFKMEEMLDAINIDEKIPDDLKRVAKLVALHKSFDVTDFDNSLRHVSRLANKEIEKLGGLSIVLMRLRQHEMMSELGIVPETPEVPETA
ncbi:MAG: hypothetical protein KBC35_03190 [Candidatus Pacebacteria bacterium]|nr:hypothetical protein [Candidatus Paceibacterota bacterium]